MGMNWSKPLIVMTFRTLLRHGAERHRDLPAQKIPDQHEEDAKARAADVDELLEVHDHGAVVVLDRGF